VRHSWAGRAAGITGPDTPAPSAAPTLTPTVATVAPTAATAAPTRAQVVLPKRDDTASPSVAPSLAPTHPRAWLVSQQGARACGADGNRHAEFTLQPTVAPTTAGPTVSPSEEPTLQPTLSPTMAPTVKATDEPTSIDENPSPGAHGPSERVVDVPPAQAATTSRTC
jgi:hypothetical protein